MKKTFVLLIATVILGLQLLLPTSVTAQGAAASPTATASTDGSGATTVGAAATGPAAMVGQSKTVVANDTSCSGLWNNISSPATCIARAAFATMGAFLIFIGVKLLTIAGMIFEFMLQNTVVNFAAFFSNIEPGVNVAWTVLRNISNMLIIGLFTFIAICIILGLKEYGQKKLVARVLIIAVLINFSLLFTKLIIDASNFTAYQFYAATLQKADQAGAVAGANSGEEKVALNSTGIAASFMQYLGMTGFGDNYDELSRIQKTNQNALSGLAIGVWSFIVLVAVALIFFYGTYLLLSRAVLFIFLMVTSGLAFATYLVPSLSQNYGWSRWWKSLIESAVLAPILMMMLWVTLTISSQVSAKFGTGQQAGTLGKLASGEVSAGISALFSYVIILALLFAAFKISSKFSTSVSAVGGGLVSAALAPVSLAARMALPVVGGTAAALAARRQTALNKESKGASRMAGQSLTSYDIHKDKNPALAAQARRASTELQDTATQKALRAAQFGKMKETALKTSGLGGIGSALVKKVQGEKKAPVPGGLTEKEAKKITSGVESDIKQSRSGEAERIRANAAAEKSEQDKKTADGLAGIISKAAHEATTGPKIPAKAEAGKEADAVRAEALKTEPKVSEAPKDTSSEAKSDARTGEAARDNENKADNRTSTDNSEAIKQLASSVESLAQKETSRVDSSMEKPTVVVPQVEVHTDAQDPLNREKVIHMNSGAAATSEMRHQADRIRAASERSVIVQTSKIDETSKVVLHDHIEEGQASILSSTNGVAANDNNIPQTPDAMNDNNNLKPAVESIASASREQARSGSSTFQRLAAIKARQNTRPTSLPPQIPPTSK